ncbi:MAG: NAD-dependent deacylase [Calditrichaeota bacterium]|nr:MAG: NAD-dependent deacylase [Calditrichota bacterium]
MFSKELKSALRSAKNIVCLTGAGFSAESGIPTFRGEKGLWKNYSPEELATPQAFLQNPELVWEWYTFRKKLILGAEPNAGHFALTELENSVEKFHLITQNVDNLHQRAGTQNVTELHGNIFKCRCFRCGKDFEEGLPLQEEIPSCTFCGDLIRPGVVWFGESLPFNAFSDSAIFARSADFFILAGTSAVVYPAAELPIYALNEGAFVLEINPERTRLSTLVSESILEKSGTVLPELIKILK